MTENEMPDVNLADELVKERQAKADLEARLAEAEKLKKQAEIALINTGAVSEEKHLKKASEYAKIFKSKKSMTNRDFIQNSVDYREAMIAETGLDPWGDKGEATEKTKEIAESLKGLLEEYPDSTEFNLKLQSSLQDDTSLVAKLGLNRKK